MPAEDEEVLERLRQALRAPDAQPSAAEVAELRRAVAERDPLPAPRRAWPRRVAAVAAAAAILVVLVAGPPLPRPVRSLARAVGLPVDSAEVADAKSAASELQAALDGGDPARVAKASARLERRLQALREADRRRLAQRSDPLLERARRSQSGTGAPAGSGPPTSRGGPTTTGPVTTLPSSRSSSTTTTTSTSTPYPSTSTTTGRTSTTTR